MLEHEGAGFADLPEEEGIRRSRGARARPSSGRSRTATSPSSGSGSTSCPRSRRSTIRGGSSARSSCSHARGLTFEADGALWLRTTAVRRRQGPRAAEGRRQLHLPRPRHRLPHRQARPRLRSGDRRVGGRSPRLHPPHARGARGARLSAGVLRRGPGAARQGGARRGRGEDVEAERRVRHPARPVRGGGGGRGALLLPHAQGRDARSISTSTSPSGRPTRTRSSTCRWRTRA